MGGFSNIGDRSGWDDIRSALTTALHGVGSLAPHSVPAPSAASAVSEAQLSPLAEMTGTLRQLQKSDPSKFREVSRQIAADLRTDAQSAQSEGETTTATRLNQLAGAFATAAESGNLPNLQDLIALESV